MIYETSLKLTAKLPKFDWLHEPKSLQIFGCPQECQPSLVLNTHKSIWRCLCFQFWKRMTLCLSLRPQEWEIPILFEDPSKALTLPCFPRQHRGASRTAFTFWRIHRCSWWRSENPNKELLNRIILLEKNTWRLIWWSCSARRRSNEIKHLPVF